MRAPESPTNKHLDLYSSSLLGCSCFQSSPLRMLSRTSSSRLDSLTLEHGSALQFSFGAGDVILPCFSHARIPGHHPSAITLSFLAERTMPRRSLVLWRAASALRASTAKSSLSVTSLEYSGGGEAT